MRPPKNIPLAKVYLTADFNERREVRRVAKLLEELGYSVISSWYKDMGYPPAGKAAATIALRNLGELLTADIVLAIGPTTGRKVMYELGFARAFGARVVLAGMREPKHIYDELVNEEYPTVESALHAFEKTATLRYKKPKFDLPPSIDNDVDSVYEEEAAEKWPAG